MDEGHRSWGNRVEGEELLSSFSCSPFLSPLSSFSLCPCHQPAHSPGVSPHAQPQGQTGDRSEVQVQFQFCQTDKQFKERRALGRENKAAVRSEQGCGGRQVSKWEGAVERKAHLNVSF